MGTESEAMPEPTGKTRDRWTGLATLGLLMIAAGPASMLAAGAAFGMKFDEVGFFAVIMAIALVGAVLVRFLPWWGKIFGIVAALASAVPTFWTAFGLAQPSNVFDFLPGLLGLPGGLIAIVSCIASMVAHRRGHVGTRASGGERTWIRAVLAVLGVAVVVSGVLTYLDRDTDSATGFVTKTVAAKDFSFSPATLEAKGAETILVENKDPFFHTFTIDELNIDVELTAGDRILVTLPDTPGEYRFYCKPHSSSSPEPDEGSATEGADAQESGDMAGQITVS